MGTSEKKNKHMTLDDRIEKQFNGKSAYDMFSFAYSEDLASALGISFVPANEVIQSPKLLVKSFSL